MNASIDHKNEGSEDQVHEATDALQRIADEVERERAERGRSDLDQLHLSDGEALADTVESSQEQPGAPAEIGDGDAPEAEPAVGLTEQGAYGAIPIQNGMRNPH